MKARRFEGEACMGLSIAFKPDAVAVIATPNKSGGSNPGANASTMASLPLDCFDAALLAMTTTDRRFLHHIPGRARSEVSGCVNLPTLRDPGTRANASAPGSRVSLRSCGKVELPGVGTASWPGLARPSTTVLFPPWMPGPRPGMTRVYLMRRGTPGFPSSHSNAARSHLPKSAAASYVLCKKSSSIASGSFALRTAS